jgi:hypothetical protein
MMPSSLIPAEAKPKNEKNKKNNHESRKKEEK